MKRRKFLRDTITGVVLPSFLQGVSLKALAGTPGIHARHASLDNDRVLVLIQLAGGNDGINTVIPFDQYSNYTAARPNIFLPQEKVLRLNGFDATAFNPALANMQQLFNEGKLGVIQAVSYPKPNFSHFRATDIWMTGSDSDKVVSSGWAGRFLNDVYPQFPDNYPNEAMPDPLAIQVGAVVSTALQGPLFTMGMAISNPAGFYKLVEGKVNVNANSRWGEQLDYIEMMSQKTDQYATVIKKAAQKVTTQSPNWPAAGKNPLADQLKIVSRLIAGGLKTKVYMVSTGSFDTHAKQTETDTTTGTHAKLLQRLSEAIGAFMNDLQFLQIENRVMGMTISEFGRRIKSNASDGTDHGAAAPVFYFGNAIKPGIIGSNPVIPEKVTANDNVPMQYDFRSLYTSVLQNWFNMPVQEVQQILMGNFSPVPIV
ncbi:hypothetical protein A4H97_14980 [Niastella yeongjuensis]|uniref:Twin-arginine translocation pathway signal n=1 Tax=Niastella yeongjuensis TaxID=354355 RepID=A0A1V9E449_9BACT|nr:DUF1501 domain-containing protein [Niastella yeongjuensis]OQP40907.1 hypothetical protein A4H97_14980 [Niastella yeongjuensis]SEO98214.1 Uncharacterized conserved protein, DUF1501 family [Niastella yeongjuensis]